MRSKDFALIEFLIIIDIIGIMTHLLLLYVFSM